MEYAKLSDRILSHGYKQLEPKSGVQEIIFSSIDVFGTGNEIVHSVMTFASLDLVCLLFWLETLCCIV